jgi:hypothetical protein
VSNVLDPGLIAESYNDMEDKTWTKINLCRSVRAVPCQWKKQMALAPTKAAKNQFYKDAFFWGLVLWLIGYLLGMILFFVVPSDMIGWVIMPIGIIITLWVLFKKIKGDSLHYYLYLAIVWTLTAIVFDYLFIVKALASGWILQT